MATPLKLRLVGSVPNLAKGADVSALQAQVSNWTITKTEIFRITLTASEILCEITVGAASGPLKPSVPEIWCTHVPVYGAATQPKLWDQFYSCFGRKEKEVGGLTLSRA